MHHIGTKRTEIGTDYSQQYFTPPQTQTQPPLKKKRNLSANPGFLFIICLIFKLVSIVYFWFWFWFVCCMCLSSLMFISIGLNFSFIFLVWCLFFSSLFYLDPKAEVVSLSPKTLLASNRFIFEDSAFEGE